jgi:hypothetical protein
MTGFNSKRMMAREAETLNERIRGLAEQAGFVMWGDESYNSGDVIDWSSSYDNELKKFAELIVKECADVATMNQFQYDAVGNYVLKHFGVEE